MRILLIEQKDQTTDDIRFYDFYMEKDHPVLKLLDRIQANKDLGNPVEVDDICDLEDSLTEDKGCQLNPDSIFAGEIANIATISKYPRNMDIPFDKVYYFQFGT